jgi:hypothetical protein
MTIAATRPAVPSGPGIGLSHDVRPGNPMVGCDVTTTGRAAVPSGWFDRPRRVVMSAIVACTLATVPPCPATRTSAIFARMLPR